MSSKSKGASESDVKEQGYRPIHDDVHQAAREAERRKHRRVLKVLAMALAGTLVIALAMAFFNVLSGPRLDLTGDKCRQMGEYPDKKLISLRVLNGTSTPGVATRLSGKLKSRGFTIAQVGEAEVDDPTRLPQLQMIFNPEKSKLAAEVLKEHLGEDVESISNDATTNAFVVQINTADPTIVDVDAAEKAVEELIERGKKLQALCENQ